MEGQEDLMEVATEESKHGVAEKEAKGGIVVTAMEVVEINEGAKFVTKVDDDEATTYADNATVDE